MARWIALFIGLLMLLTGCLKPLVTGSPTPIGQARQVEAATEAVAPLTGRVESFPYQAQSATMADIAVGSTVSLIDTVTNRTMGTTVTDSAGRFTIKFSVSFRPTANVYYLEAYKGLPVGGTPNRAGTSMARVRTLVRNVSGEWRHLYAEEGIRISAASTALAVITSLRSASDSTRVDPVNLLGTLDNSSVFTSAGTGVSDAEFQTVRGMVSQALVNDDDPLYRITYDLVGRAFFLVDRGVSIARVAPVQGPMGTTVTVEGTNLGLAPVVRFNGTAATSTVNGTSTLITATVPVGATSGPVTVQVGTIVFNGANFAVTPWDGHNVFDAAGNMYVASSQDNRIYRFDPSGTPTVYASGAPINYPRGLVVDPEGNVYVANWNDSKILKIDTSRNVTVFAQGNGISNPLGLAMNGAGDLFIGNWSAANILRIASGSTTPTVYATGGFNGPWGLAFDTSSNLYVSNWNSGVITKVAPNGTTSILTSGLPTPAGVALDSLGNIYVGCYGGHNIYKLTPSGGIGIFASAPNYPGSVAIHPDGTLYMASYLYNYLSRYDRTGRILGYWSAGHLTWSLKSNPTTKDLYVSSGIGWGAYTKSIYRMPFNSGTNDYDPPRRVVSGLPNPSAIALNGANRLYVGDWGGLIFDADLTTGNYSTVASGLGAIADLAVDGANNLYAAAWSNHALYRMANGAVTRRYGFSWYYNNAAFGPDGYLYVPDYWQGKVLRVSPSGVISTFSDNGGSGFGNPHGIAFDAAGNVYVSSWSWNKIYRIPAGGGAATEYVSSGMSTPNGMAFDNAGNLYVANWSDSTVKIVPPGGGSVSNYATGFSNPRGLGIDRATGNLYVANWNGTVHKITPNGATGTVSSYATGVGQAMQAFFDSTTGDVLVAGYNTSTVYRIPPGGGTVETLASLPTSVGGVVKDAAGNMYALGWDSPNIYKFAAGATNYRLWAASLRTPAGVALSPDGLSAYVTDWSNYVVYKVALTSGDISIAANSADWSGGANSLKGIAFDPAGTSLYVAAWGNGVWKLDPTTINSGNNAGVVRYGNNNAGAGILGGIAFGANNNLYGTSYEWVNNGSSPVTYVPPGTTSGGGGNGTNMTNWPRFFAF